MGSTDDRYHDDEHGDLTLRDAFRRDVAGASALRVVLLLALPALVVFEWGTGNDFVNVVAISRTYESLSGVVAVLGAAAAGFTVPFLTQLLTGTVAALALPSLVATGRHLYRRAAAAHEQFADVSYHGLARTDRWILSVALGTSAAVLLEQSTTHKSGFRALRPTVLESAFYMGGTTAIVSGIIATLLELGRLQPSIEPMVDPTVSVLANPFVWMAVFTLLGVYRFTSSRRRGGERS